MDNSNLQKLILRSLSKLFRAGYEKRYQNVRFTTEIPSFLRPLFYIFLYLNIYTVFSSLGYAQEFSLEIEAEVTVSSGLRDSLNIPQSFIDFKTVNAEADSIQKRLMTFGYLESKLEELKKKNDSVFLATYFFGRKYSYLKVFYDPELFDRKELRRISEEVTPEYFVLPFPLVETALTKLNQMKANSGNAFARIKLTDFKAEGNVMNAQLFLDPGGKRTVDSIVVKGYEKFPRSFLRYYAGVRKGKPFNREQIEQQNDVLNSLGFVQTLKAPEVLFREQQTTVFFYLEKRNNNLFDGILGFATDEETSRLQFNGYLNLELNNNLHFGERLTINYKADGNEQQNFRTNVQLPYLFGSPVGTELELKIFKRDSTFITTDQVAKVTYQVTPTSRAYVGYKASESSNLLDEILAGSTVVDYTANYALAGLEYNKPQNDLLFPWKTQVALAGEFGQRKLTDRSEDQTRLELTAGNIFNLNYENSVFLRNVTGILLSDSYLTNELFRFGGINSIRGFNENSIDASLYALLNTEYRYRFNEGFYLHSIIDLAYFENKTADLEQELYSFGIGLGLLTKAGVLRFNIANGISENQNFNFSNTKIHLSLSSRF